MKLKLAALFVLGGMSCAGCESLNQSLGGWSRKDRQLADQLAMDQQRRSAMDQQIIRPKSSNAKAIQQTNFAPQSPTDPLEAQLLKAKQAEQARQNQVARSLYEEVLQQNPQHAEAHHRLGVLADQDRRYLDAQMHYQAALQLQPQNATLLSDIGYSYYSQDRLNEAELYLVQALQLQPENQYARNNLAQVYGQRALQTGSAADYQLAREQFTLALGPAGAEQQMAQLFPAQAGNPERKSLLNPFKKLGGNEKTLARGGSTLQAPEPDDGNAKLLKQMQEIRAQMEATGELPNRNAIGQAGGQATATAALPLDRVNSELSRIDTEAQRQMSEALRRSDALQRERFAGNGAQAWGPNGGIQQSANWEQSHNYAGSSGGPGAADSPMIQPANRQQAYQGGDGRNPSGGWGGPQIAGNSDGHAGAAPQHGMSGRNGAAQAGWEHSMADSSMASSWPDPQGAPTQLDARGLAWDGHSVIQPASNMRQKGGTMGADGFSGGPAPSWTGEMASSGMSNGDPRYARGSQAGQLPPWMDLPNQYNQGQYNQGGAPGMAADGPGQPGMMSATGAMNGATNWGAPGAYGPQRPGPRGAGSAGNPGANAAGWDDGRQAAAQLGLDAGMGEMFPGHSGGPMGAAGGGGTPQGGMGGSAWQQPGFDNGGRYSNPDRMPAGGNPSMENVDYRAAGPSYQQPGMSQGVVPAMGETYGAYGAAGGDVVAPWNQAPGGPAATGPRGGAGLYQDAGQSGSGRFAPSSRTTPRNFGAPPMYYGR